jgi:hypothetical protein
MLTLPTSNQTNIIPAALCIGCAVDAGFSLT